VVITERISKTNTVKKSDTPIIMAIRQSIHLKTVLSERNTSSKRKASPLTNVNLDLASIEAFLTKVFPDYCPTGNLSLLHQAEQYRGFAASHAADRGGRLKKFETEALSCILSAVLDCSNLPSQWVSYVQYTMGLLDQARGEHQRATDSFKKALWVVTARKHTMAHEIGLILHQLGISYARMGDTKEAVADLDRALRLYEISGLADDHPCIVSAQNELNKLRRPGGPRRASSGNLRQSFASIRRLSSISYGTGN
jgi:tetratricopeptide (TPR) repeat protein